MNERVAQFVNWAHQKKLDYAAGAILAIAAAACGGKAQDQEGGSGVRIETQSPVATATPEPTTITIYGVELDRKELQKKWQWDERGPKTEDIGKNPLPADVKAFLDGLMQKWPPGSLSGGGAGTPQGCPLCFAYAEVPDERSRLSFRRDVLSNILGICQFFRGKSAEFNECKAIAVKWVDFAKRDFPDLFERQKVSWQESLDLLK